MLLPTDHHAALGMRDVHRPALALAGAGGLAGDLGPQQPRRHALGEHVVDAAVDRADGVPVGEVHRHGRRNRLLSARRVVRRDDLAGPDDRSEALVVALDQRHAAVDVEQHGPLDS